MLFPPRFLSLFSARLPLFPLLRRQRFACALPGGRSDLPLPLTLALTLPPARAWPLAGALALFSTLALGRTLALTRSLPLTGAIPLPLPVARPVASPFSLALRVLQVVFAKTCVPIVR
ncbi:hypothetical protein GTO91_04800 [Heliobacterium undosum]|uniref:Uncharacterized protein n=1 Tax=Heliomicrobium undosum TaxID=121734 RepID=A0A845L1X1_9FIRM|nr:hypothetical protein [Heliomicrobium undosum]MZP29029.1 hypothetical protein [Heliomicrobium undosum]